MGIWEIESMLRGLKGCGVSGEALGNAVLVLGKKDFEVGEKIRKRSEEI